MKGFAEPLNATERTAKAAFGKKYLEMLTIWENLDYAEVPVDYSRFGQDNPELVTMLNLSPCVTWIFDQAPGFTEVIGVGNAVYKR